VSEVNRILDQMTRAFEGDAWHGPSLRESLADVDARQASAHPIPNAHSIWEIVLHLAAWLPAVRARCEGRAVELDGADDWPPVREGSESSWHAALATLEQRHRDLLTYVRNLQDNRLADPIPNRDYDVYFLLHGALQHHLYHAGQIVLLKRALAARTAAD